MIGSLRARIQRLEAALPSPTRRFIVVVGAPDQVDRALLAALPGEVTVVSTGVPRVPLDEGPRAPTVWEEAADGRWFLADQDLAA
jgi:hypothetical protein